MACSGQKVCRTCGVEKFLSAFPRASSKAELQVRYGPHCKPCKAQIERRRRESIQDPSPLLQQGSASAVVPVSAEVEAALNLIHPEYEEWEIKRAVKVINRLRQWRNEARENGEIDW